MIRVFSWRPKSLHIEPALLHGYAIAEVDPMAKKTIEAHLEDCETCQSRLQQVTSGFSLLAPDEIPELSVLDWRRIELQVRRRLEKETISPPSGRWGRLLGGRPMANPAGWILGLSTSAALGIVFLAAPWQETKPVLTVAQGEENSSAKRTFQMPKQTPAAELIAAVDGSERVLRSGRKFRIRGPGLATIQDSGFELPVFQLGRGELEVTEIIKENGRVQPLGIKAAGFHATAQSSEFAVRYWAEAVELEVSDGHVDVHVPKDQAGLVRRGEKKRVVLRKRPARVEPPRFAARVVEPEELSSPKLTEEVEPEPVAIESTPELQVDVIPPESDQISKLWAQADRDYYRNGQVGAAIDTAKRILDLREPDRAEYGQALNLLCEAYIGARRSKEAVYYCEAALTRETVSERRRSLHRRLGLMYGDLQDECQRAVEHFTKALAFGNPTLLDEGTILGRARCALELGDAFLARSDLEQLKSRGSRLVRRIEVQTLLHSLKHRQNTKVRK